MLQQTITNDTPVAMLTVGQLKEALGVIQSAPVQTVQAEAGKHYVYGIDGIARTFGCSMPTACRIKASGKIDAAIKQIGRKIVVDAELALELAGKKTGGRK
ncbi:hypothetical protein Barb6_01003 [Bacteroidales bacterium Barb6]|nr:hypothetical protein Barb6_01003 [Bacteroidales bacterium Barb6]